VFARERRRHAAVPQKEGGDRPIIQRHLAGAEMADHVGEDRRHDEISDEHEVRSKAGKLAVIDPGEEDGFALLI
jgi:hypothetical protein